MAGIYIHIPFCKQACSYCNFHFSISLRQKNDFLAALLKEIDFRRDYLAGEPVETIYLGGGTPSLLTPSQLDRIIKNIYEVFPIRGEPEITLEANPDDMDRVKIREWKNTGINRLSIGVQSFMDRELVLMNRAHDARQAMDCIRQAKESFPNISADLIYGTASLTEREWEENLDAAISLDLQHLSCYALTIEPKTPLARMIREKKAKDIDPDIQASQFVSLMKRLEQAGFEHYEISNFAKAGKRSRHNASYWEGKKYLGLGPSAHSYDKVSRQWNIANNTLYIQSLEKGELRFERETLTGAQILNEYIMTSLRTSEGCDLAYIRSLSDGESANTVRIKAESHIRIGRLYEDKQRLILTNSGKLFADGISADLFF